MAEFSEEAGPMRRRRALRLIMIKEILISAGPKRIFDHLSRT